MVEVVTVQRAANKAARLNQIEMLLLAHPGGLTPAEIARRLKVHRSTIGRDLPDLPGHIYIDEEDGGRWKIDREAYLVNVRLNLHEAMALHLAARLMVNCMDKSSVHAATALRKLGLALEKLAPRISTHLLASAGLMDDIARRHDPVYMQVLESLTTAWSMGRKVRLKHQSAPGQQVNEYVFSPYFIEPYAVGRTSHVIGWREPPNALRTLKLERIKAITLLEEGYEIPAGFNMDVLLRDAWGIWYTEDEPVEVVLRFHPRVAGRVRETQWHASEKLEDLPDGYLVWKARVAETLEMMPWIRGWGPDVEVLEPPALRARVAEEMRQAAQLYGE